ncbi:hypothetical protein Rumeso_00962 [Rubellimicrobium mesophilum DSM 19309]|uniref:DnaJ homologue subfamily C member 28 conserved domain-containing protein n=1 Tax=Rubellimicrobium mesophilum DSM 19309 TaxID=442562 RepID=A0A017HTC1_9RHOB|nr:hypothetical protein Rumeso_00962 [Rubellimicrobium mesophilum DSM 19309]
MSSFLDSLVSPALAEAQAKGALDNLPGAGKPIPPETLARSACDDLYARALSESGAVHPLPKFRAGSPWLAPLGLRPSCASPSALRPPLHRWHHLRLSLQPRRLQPSHFGLPLLGPRFGDLPRDAGRLLSAALGRGEDAAVGRDGLGGQGAPTLREGVGHHDVERVGAGCHGQVLSGTAPSERGPEAKIAVAGGCAGSRTRAPIWT